MPLDTRPRSHATATLIAQSMSWPSVIDGRFELQTEIMHTGSARLFRAWDARFKTAAAVKLISRPLLTAGALETPAELQFKHPYLVRLLDRGQYDNGDWLAMDWVEGGTLLDLIRGYHRTDERDLYTRPVKTDQPAPTTTVDPATIRQLLHLLSEAASGLGAAHAQGVVHLDLKPNNIMYEPLDTPRGRSARPMAWRAWVEDEQGRDRAYGRDGEARAGLRVLIPRLIDWELSRRDGDPPPGGDEILGVPSYLAPEYVLRQPIRSTTDVYALGAILYHILGGQRPYAGIERRDVLDRLAAGIAPEPVRFHPGLEPFGAVCTRAMAMDARARHTDGAEFCHALRQAQAECILLRAQDLRQRTVDLRNESRRLRSRANDALRVVGFSQALLKRPAWTLQDKADELEDEAYQYEARWAQEVRAVLTIDPELAVGRASLIGWMTDRYRATTREGRRREAKLLLGELATERKLFQDLRLDPLPPELAPIIRAADDTLSNRTHLTLHTAPAAEIEIAQTTVEGRRIQLEEWMPLGHGSVERVGLPAGRVVLRIRAPGHGDVIYPTELVAGEPWTLTPPGAERPITLQLPPLGAVDDEVAFIAPGWCYLGGQAYAPDAPEGRRAWIDGFFIQKKPITHGEWLALMHAVARTQPDKAWDLRPRVAMLSGAVPIYEQRGDGRFDCAMLGVHDAEVKRWPVSGITWEDARAYARWRSQRDGLSWRLPCEWEFEKASRCNDSRRLPWGEHMEETWTRVVGSTEESYRVASVDFDAGDRTVHGVCWTVGNVLTWCLDTFTFDGPPADSRLVLPEVGPAEPRATRMMRGAAYQHPAALVSSSSRWASDSERRTPACGLRLVRSFHPRPPTA